MIYTRRSSYLKELYRLLPLATTSLAICLNSRGVATGGGGSDTGRQNEKTAMLSAIGGAHVGYLKHSTFVVGGGAFLL